jgi:hypothetical protein
MRDLFFERAVVQLVVLQQQTQTLEQSDHDVLLLERAAAHLDELEADSVLALPAAGAMGRTRRSMRRFSECGRGDAVHHRARSLRQDVAG